jgi:predicted RNase H-like HicB family nuclease
MTELRTYQTAALKQAVIERMDDAEGYCARIPGFNGLVVFGDTLRETKKELASVLEGWIAVALKFGDGLPELNASRKRGRAVLAAMH